MSRLGFVRRLVFYETPNPVSSIVQSKTDCYEMERNELVMYGALDLVLLWDQFQNLGIDDVVHGSLLISDCDQTLRSIPWG